MGGERSTGVMTPHPARLAMGALLMACLLSFGMVSSAGAVLAQPTIATSASGSVVVGGGQLYDTAVLTGGVSPTGTVTFRLYAPGNGCTYPPAFTSANALSGGGATSTVYTPDVGGTFRWTASYSGDANNAPTAGACNDPNENVFVSRVSPTITAKASGPAQVGGQISDSATVTGAVVAGPYPCSGVFDPPPGGACAANLQLQSLSFVLWGPKDPGCTGTPVFASGRSAIVIPRPGATPAVIENGSYNSAPFTPTVPGIYRWTASILGDAANNPAATACNAPNQSVLVVPGINKQLLRTLSISPASFRAAGSGPSIAAVAGGMVSYSLSEAASVTFRVERPLPGRRVRGRCVAPKRSNARSRKCTRYVALRSSFTHTGKAGTNKLKFTGRLRGRKLAPGRYRLRGQATDPAGNKSPLRHIPFRIVPR